jgi:hypothetical protein
MKLKLIPLEYRSGCYEPIRVDIQNGSEGNYYPACIIHIDTFWEGKGGNNKIYDLLGKGKMVIVEAKLEVVE